MGTYIALLTFATDGHDRLRAAPTLLETCIKSYETDGLEVRGAYLTLGVHDALVVLEAANDAAVARLTSLGIGSRPEVTSHVLRGFSREQYREFLLRDSAEGSASRPVEAKRGTHERG